MHTHTHTRTQTHARTHTGSLTDDLRWPTLWVCKLKALWTRWVNEVDGLIVTHHSHSFSARFLLGSIVHWKEVKPNFRGNERDQDPTNDRKRNVTKAGPSWREGCVFSLVIGRVLYIPHYMQQMFTGPLAMEKPTVDSLYFFSLSANTSWFPPVLVMPPLSVYLSLFISLFHSLPLSLSRSLSFFSSLLHKL